MLWMFVFVDVKVVEVVVDVEEVIVVDVDVVIVVDVDVVFVVDFNVFLLWMLMFVL